MSEFPLILLLLLVGASLGQRSLEVTWPVVVPVVRSLAENASNEQCVQDASSLLRALDNATFWAVRMADASGSLPSGLLSGSTFSLGDFDACTEDWTAHYCLTSLRLHGENSTGAPRSAYTAVHPPAPNSPAWHHMRRSGERWRALRDELHVGLCLPSSCTDEDTRHAADEALKARFSNLRVTLRSSEVTCSDRKHLSEPFSGSEIAFCVFMVSLFLVVLSATVTDILSSKVVPTVRSFSLRYQLTSFFSSGGTRGGNVLLDVLRCLSLLLIVMSHKMEFTMIGPLKNPNFIEQSYTKLELQPMLNPSLVVDTFFFLGGLALTGKLLSAPLNTPLWSLYLQRYLRLTPPYMLVVFFYASLLPRLGSGPIWNVLVQRESQYCKDNWWTNALYVNNYVKPEEMCLMHSWYLPCDMHLYLVCAPLVLLLSRRPRLALSLLAVLGVLSVLAPFIVIYWRDTDPFLLVLFEFLRSDRQYPYFTDIYVKSHLRATPYLGGILAGYLGATFAKRPLSMGRSVLLLGLGALVASLTSVSGAPFYMAAEGVLATSRLGRAAYGAAHRATWAAGLTCIVAGATSLRHRLSKIKPAVSHGAGKMMRVAFPLASLCYCTYLVHVAVITYSGATIRDPVYTNEILLGIRTFGDTAASFLVALGLYLLVEAPARDLAKLALTPSKPDDSSEKTQETVFVARL